MQAALALLVCFGLAALLPGMLSPGNLENLLIAAGPLLILAIGQSAVLLVAGIDLSQATVMGLVSAVGGALLAMSGDATVLGATPVWGVLIGDEGGALSASPMAVPLVILLMMFLGTLVGTVNGLCVALLRMPPLIATLVTQSWLGAIALWLLRSERVSDMPEGLVAITSTSWFFLSGSTVLTLLVAGSAYLVLERSVLGRYVYATGMNAHTARVSGIPVRATVIAAYMFSGACAGLAGMLLTSVQESGSPAAGAGLLLDVIGAAVIGGVSLFGGRGRIIGVLAGVLFFVLLDNVLNLLSLQFYTIMLLKAALIIAAAAFDLRRNRNGGRT